MLQQTPSTQKVLAHWLAAVQALPAVRLTWQVLLASQKKPFWHSPSPLHIDEQEPLLQVWPPVHIVVGPGWQVLAALQVLAPVSVEPVQLPAAQTIPTG